MKKIIAITAIMACFFGGMLAQGSVKIGHINTDELLASLPESDSAQKKIQASYTEVQNTLEELNVSLNVLYEEYVQNQSNYSADMRQMKETEIQDKQKRIQEYQVTQEQKLQQLRQELLNPIIENVVGKINEVAQENNFSYVLDSSQGKAVLFVGEGSIDITDLVKTKLGLK